MESKRCKESAIVFSAGFCGFNGFTLAARKHVTGLLNSSHHIQTLPRLHRRTTTERINRVLEHDVHLTLIASVPPRICKLVKMVSIR